MTARSGATHLPLATNSGLSRYGCTTEVHIEQDPRLQFHRDARMHMFKPGGGKGWRKSHSEARLAAIVDSSSDAIISLDLTGAIVSWNLAAQKLFGHTEDQMIGNLIFILIPEERHADEVKILRRVELGERIETFETTRRTRDGTLVHVSITISPIRDKRGGIIGASNIAREITESREKERRLKLLLKEINHRVKNQYAVILAVIGQTAAREQNIKIFETRVRERIMALSHSQDLLSSVDWAGVDLRHLISHQLKGAGSDELVSMSGPEILLNANAVLNLGMALHELVVNRIKFSGPHQSDVELSWAIDPLSDGAQFQITWNETCVKEPDLLAHENGFGALVLKRIVAAALRGSSSWTAREGRIVWTLAAPLSHVQF